MSHCVTSTTLTTGDILMRKRKKYQEKEEIRHPDSPE
nr:MAG TPA: hypothetical protein [Caudoviricetes sp.]